MLTLIPVRGLPLIRDGDPLADLIVSALAAEGGAIQHGDVLVVAQKVVSKAEGRTVALDDVSPSADAMTLSEQSGKDPRLAELILRESREVLRVRPGVVIVEDVRGFVCANAGIDRSNVEQTSQGERVLLLPVDPDASARALAARMRQLTGVSMAVIINDSHGRAWREGTAGVAIGLSGMPALWDRRGERDLTGYALQATVIGLADEIASSASLLMGPAAEAVPAVVVRGLEFPSGDGSARDLQRARERDLFR